MLLPFLLYNPRTLHLLMLCDHRTTLLGRSDPESPLNRGLTPIGAPSRFVFGLVVTKAGYVAPWLPVLREIVKDRVIVTPAYYCLHSSSMATAK